MNCNSFQTELPEYVEGSLTAEQHQTADAHLAECAACRQRLQQEQSLAQTLGREFQRSTAHLTLPPDFSDRLLAALAVDETEKIIPLAESSPANWLRLAWPVAMAASVLFACFHAIQHSPPKAGYPQMSARAGVRVTPPVISIHYEYCAPTLAFQRNGNQVLDVLECTPRQMDITFHRDQPATSL